MKNVVIATGGGSILREKSRKNIRKYGHVVYLQTSAELLYSRIRYDKSRPLMQTNSPLETLKQLLSDREPYYLELADSVIKTGKQKAGVIVKRLEEALDKSPQNRLET